MLKYWRAGAVNLGAQISIEGLGLHFTHPVIAALCSRGAVLLFLQCVRCRASRALQRKLVPIYTYV